MPLSTAAAIGISAGVAAATGGAQIAMSGKMNQRAAHEARRTRAWQTSEREAQQDWARQQWEDTNAWNLEQWNRQNEYNSPEQQLERWKAAGMNPLSIDSQAIPASELSASPASAGGAPGASLPQMFNPAEGVNTIANAVNQYALNSLKDRELDQKQLMTTHQVEWLDAQKQTEDLLRNRKFELAGVDVILHGDQAALARWNAKEVQSMIAYNSVRMDNLRAVTRNLGIDFDAKSFDLFAKKTSFPLEQKLLASKIAQNWSASHLMDSRRSTERYKQYNLAQDSKNRGLDYDIKSNWWNTYGKESQRLDYVGKVHDTNIKMYNKKAAKWNAEMSRQQTEDFIGWRYDDKTKAFLKGIRTAKEFQDLLNGTTNILQGYSQFKLNGSRAKWLESMKNPSAPFSSSAPSASSSSLYPSRSPRTPSDGFSMKMNGWMPKEYFE